MVLIKELAKSTVVLGRAFNSRPVGRIIAARNRVGGATTTARDNRMAMQTEEVGMMQRRT